MEKVQEQHLSDMTYREQKKKLIKLVSDLGWDYDRLSSSGMETYDKLCDLLGIQ